MISKRKKLSWIIMAVFLISMVLPGFSQPAQADVTLTLEDLAPANGVTGVPVNVPLLITFTEEVGLPSGYEANVIVEQSADGFTYAPIPAITVTPILVTGQPTHVISIIPNSNQWNPNMHCRVTLNPGAIVEVSNGLSTGVTNTLITANFQTGTTAAVGGGAVGGGSGGSGGTIPPTGGSGGVNPGVTNIVVVSTTPSESILMQNGTATAPAPTNIPTNLDFIGMQFSEAMNQSSVETPGNITLTYLDGSETVSVTGAAKYMCDCQYGDNPPPFVPYHAHFEPSEASQTLQLLDDTEYTLTLANLQSLAGVELSATSVSFTTVATSGGGTGMSIGLAQTDDLIAGQSIDLVVTGAQDSAGTKLSGIYSINLASTLQTLTTTTIGNVSFSEGAATITIPEGVITTLGTHTLTIPIRSGTDIITIGNVQVPIVSPASIDVSQSSAAMDYTGTSAIPAGINLAAKDAYGNPIAGYQFTGKVRVVNQNAAILESYTINGTNISSDATLTNIPATGTAGVASLPLVIPEVDIYDGMTFQFYLADGITKVSGGNPPSYSNSPQSSFHQALPVVRLSADAYQGTGPNYVVIKGQEAQVLIGVDLQGTAVPQDGFTFTLSGLSGGAYTITPVPLKTVSGGLVLSIDTTLLSSATYNLVVQANTGVGTVNSAPFSLQVINNSVNDVQARFFTPTFTHEYLNDALEITKQGRVFIGYDGLITGNEKIYDQSTAPFRDLQVVSTDPSVVAVYPNQYGSFDIYAVKTGTANIKVMAPDNNTVLGQQVINVNIASDSPQISSIGVNPYMISNNGSAINISATANQTVGISILGLLGGEWGDGGWYDNNCSYSNTYTPAVGEVPGTYFLEASVSSGSDNISLITPFTIINDATKGELRGNIFNLEPMAAGPMDASGYMELYTLDSGGQTPAIRQHVWSMTSDYVLSYITPGEYKVKFIPDNSTLRSQWYPNASSFAAADTRSIQAGSSLQDINFFILPAGTDPVWVTASPKQMNPGYCATTITVTQQPQQTWRADETLKIQIFRLGAATAVAGLENLAPTTGTVTDTSFNFTLPAALAHSVYRIAIYRGDTLIANSRIQVGGPWTEPSAIKRGYSPVTMTVHQNDSAFWQEGNDLTLNVIQENDTGGVTPIGFEAPIAATNVTATAFNLTLNTGLPPGKYFVLIKRGNETLTGAPFKIIIDINFADLDDDHVYFNGNNFSASITVPGLETLPPQAAFTASAGILTTPESSDMDISKSVFVGQPTVSRSGSILTVTGTINNPENNTLAAGLIGLLIQPPPPPVGGPASSPIGPIPVIDITGKPALVGIGIPNSQGDISVGPALSTVANLYNTGQAMIFTRINPTNSQVMGTITFPAGLNIIDNRDQLSALYDAIKIVAQSTPTTEYYVEVNTDSLSFLRDKAATVTINNIPYSAVKVVCDGPAGVASNLHFLNGTLTFDVNHFSRYTVQENTGPLSSEARLSDVKMNETTLSGFASDTYLYNVELPAGTNTVPSLNYILYDSKASGVYTPASNLPGSSTIEVTAEDGTKKTYTINFTVGPTSGDNCFIATAAFGSKFQPSVALLRQFRDHFLMTNDLGRDFVAFYYKNSPPIAAFIAGNESLKAVVRGILTPVVGIAYLLFHPWLIYPLLMLLLASMLLWRFKRKNIRFTS